MSLVVNLHWFFSKLSPLAGEGRVRGRVSRSFFTLTPAHLPYSAHREQLLCTLKTKALGRGGENTFKILWLTALVLSLAWALAPQKAWGSCETCPEDQPLDEKIQALTLQQADDIFKEVSRLRGLPVKSPVNKTFENRAFFHDYYLKLLQEQYPPAKKIAYEKAYVLLGLLPEKTDLIQAYLDSFLEVVQGLYDPRTKTLYLANWIDPDKEEQTMAHELTHALQDQYYDLQAYMDRGRDSTMDVQFARASVMEGDAVATALNYSLEDKNENFTQLVNIADWVRMSNLLEESGEKAFGRKVNLHDVINFPYIYGASFLQKYVKAYGWQGMKYLFDHPPSSTHQIIHPEDFFPKRQKPVRVKIDDLSQNVLKDFSRIWEETFGEYGLTLLMRQYLPENEARHSASGWRGDRIQVYESRDGSRQVLTGYVVFNDEASAGDFFKSYRSLLGKKYNSEIFRRSDDTIHWISLGQGAGSSMGPAQLNRGPRQEASAQGDLEAYVERLGRRVVFIEGTTSSLTSKVRGVLWDVSRPDSKSVQKNENITPETPSGP